MKTFSKTFSLTFKGFWKMKKKIYLNIHRKCPPGAPKNKSGFPRLKWGGHLCWTLRYSFAESGNQVTVKLFNISHRPLRLNFHCVFLHFS